ncbi:hypothetical protein HYFRA_00003623 [Hymenoscyphus fraxineus]|uniref:RING-type domain-containing protein n=1 Tax=Hymenoscyphus fraxineus TaxID=746836 RepID=A0A9N9PV30_9HELO|nr:hypothetical protein HYFRA_00003623 [Hymenoscyphus fraxineus]
MPDPAMYGALSFAGSSPSATTATTATNAPAPRSISRGSAASNHSNFNLDLDNSSSQNFLHHNYNHITAANTDTDTNTNTIDPFYDLDDLTLAPIANPDADALRELPHFYNNFGSASVSGPSSPLPVTSTSNVSSNSAPQQQHHEDEAHQPPPSNQQQAQSQAIPQPIQELPSPPQYNISPDSFNDLFIPSDDLEFDISEYFELDNTTSRDSVTSMPTRTNTRRTSRPISLNLDNFIDLTSDDDRFPPSPVWPPSGGRERVGLDVDIVPRGARKRRAEEAITGSSTKKTRVSGRPSLTLKREGSSIPLDAQVIDLVDIEGSDYDEKLKEREREDKEESIKRSNLEEATRDVKLSEFNCIICMDEPTDLTITHCGHLFCGMCLHQALHAGDKKCCPVCRTAISMSYTGRGEVKKPNKHGVFHLEMKVIKRKKKLDKGKQPMRYQG